MTILAWARLTTVVPSGLSWSVRLHSGLGGLGWAYVPRAWCSGGGTGKGSAMEMGVGCVFEAAPGVWREVQELTLEETDHHTGLGRPGWGHLG